MATKRDLDALRVDLDHMRVQTKQDLESLKSDLKTDLKDDLATKLRGLFLRLPRFSSA